MLDLSDEWAGFQLYCPPVEGRERSVPFKYSLLIYRTRSYIAVRITKMRVYGTQLQQETCYVRNVRALLRLVKRRLKAAVSSSTLDELIRYIEVETTERKA